MWKQLPIRFVKMKTMNTSVINKKSVKYTKLHIEKGLKAGFEDIKHGHFEEISDTSTAKRIALFKERSKHCGR